MAISSPGIGSGLDVNSLVTQLVAAERAPTEQRLARVETTARAQISAFGAMRGGLAGIETALKKLEGVGALLGRKTTVTEGAGFTATGGTTAALGKYAISVERLATAHKLQSAAVGASIQVGHGTLSIAVGSDAPLDITIAEGKGTLADIRDAINAKSGGTSVTATVVHGDAGDVLVLSSTRVGAGGALTITSSGGNGGLAVLQTSGGTQTVTTPAADAKVIIDGIERTASSNRISDAIDGITLDLTKAEPGKSFDMEVVSDASGLKTSLQGFITAYNSSIAAMRSQSSAGGEGRTAGPLSGDSVPRSISQGLRGAISANYAELAALGIKSSVDGSLSLDSAKFDTAIAGDPEAVNRALGTDGALGLRLRETLIGIIGPKGVLSERTTALNNRLKQLDVQRENFQTRIDRIEANYRQQFTALDALMAKMQTTSSFLAQQLAGLS